MDPCADPLTPEMRAKIDAAAAVVVEYVRSGRMGGRKSFHPMRVKRPEPPRGPLHAIVLGRLRDGDKCAEIARDFGRSRSRIYQIRDSLRARGLL